MYADITRLKDSFGSKKDLLLQDVTDEQLTAILQEQSSYIDSFLLIRYELPLTGTNAIIEKLALDFAKAECYKLFAGNDIPEAIKNQERQAQKDLVKIQKGEILIQKEEPYSDDATSKPVYFTEWL